MKRKNPFYMSKLPNVPQAQFFLPMHTTYEPFYRDVIPDVFAQPNFSCTHNNSKPYTTSDSSQSTDHVLLLKRSTRASSKPSHLRDYVCNLVSFKSLPYVHRYLLAHTSSMRESDSFAQAATDPNWIQAMKLELQDLESNNTWDIVALPPGKKSIGCK